MMVRGLLALAFAFLATPVFAQEGAKPGSEWRAGVATAKITPSEMTWMAGYAARTKPAEGVAQELFAKALALEDKAGRRFVFVTTDLIGIPRRLRDDLVAEAKSKFELPAEALLLNASHTHCGPELLTNEASEWGLDAARVAMGRKYLGELKPALVGVIGRALENLGPADLVFSRARAGFAMNRRLPSPQGYQNSPYPDGPVDHEVPVLQVKDEAGKLKAVLFGYACHNTTLGFQQFCGDYAGFAQAEIEALHPGTTALFLMGCGGDQNPYPRGELALCQHHGKTLALAVETALQTKHVHLVRGPLRAAYQEVDLEFAPAPSKDELLKLKESKDRYDRRRGEFLLNELESQGKISLLYRYPIQVVRLGSDVTFAALAGETVVDFSLRLKKELAGQGAVWVAGYSNDVFGYVPSKRVLEEGGYESGGAMRYTVHPGPFAPTVEETIIKTVHDLARQTAKPAE